MVQVVQGPDHRKMTIHQPLVDVQVRAAHN